MKYLFYFYMLLISTGAFGQSETAFLSALKSNDIVTLESYLEDNIDFCLFEDQQFLNKKAALSKLKSFLGNQKISSVEVIHKGMAKNKASQYKVVKISTSGDSYRMFVYSTGEIGAKTVKEIRIDNF